VSSGESLGGFLRARRAQVDPRTVGRSIGSRRTGRGLSRQEVAALAGISVDYYTRLEQGRYIAPPSQVLQALAEALLLDAPATSQLRALGSTRTPAQDAEPADASHADLVDELPMPALVTDRHVTITASNFAAQALSNNLAPGRNRVRDLFLDPEEKRVHVDWEAAAGDGVGMLRRSLDAADDAVEIHSFVDEMRLASTDFRRLWRRPDVGFQPLSNLHLRHAGVGDLRLRRQVLDIPDSRNCCLHIYFAAPGGDSERKLRQLRTNVRARSGRGPA
jgi:transcriptional regulator with XRE-family HTH domain